MFGFGKLFKDMAQGGTSALCTAWGGHNFVRYGQHTIVCQHCGLKRRVD